MIGALDPIVAQAGGQHGIATPVSLILIAAAAFAIPLAADRVRLPAIVLEILFGVAVGPWLGFIEPGEELLGFLAEFGLFLLMFLAGFEIDFSRLERQGSRQISTGLVMFGLFFGASWFGVGLLTPESAEGQAFLALLLSAS